MGVSTAVAEEGTTSNRYTILGRLSGGGMADIFLARATTEAGVERHVVLKRVLAERSRDVMFAKMFLDEARLSAQLQHPNIAQVYDIGKLAGSYFFTMEYVHGEDVRALLQRLSVLKRPVPVNLALYLASGALAALHYAHERTASDGKALGVVHRDVTPSNVMIGYEGVVKLLDFGVAKASERLVESRSGTIKGKIAYLSPEQCHGNPIDRRSDIYSLGIVLYELLTGRRLYKRETDFATMMAIVSETVAPPSSLRPDLIPEIDRIVLTALAKDRDRRYPTAAVMLEDIESVAASERYLTTATAMGRFMRELFGERPLPWIELKTRGEEAQPVTVTSESVGSVPALDNTSDGAPAGVLEPANTASIVQQNALEAQLDQAPALWRSESTETTPEPASNELVAVAPAVAEPAVPTAIYTRKPSAPIVMVAAADTVTAVEPQTQASAPPARAIEAPTRIEPVVEALAPAPSRALLRRPAILAAIAGGALLLAIAVVIATRSGSSEAPADGPAPPVAVAPAVPGDAPVTPPADAGTIDQPPRIADAVAKSDWPGALRLCADQKARSLTADDRMRCGVAACNARQRATALGYFQVAAKPGQVAIEQACRGRGISLSSSPATDHGHPPPRDPCESKTYRATHALKCP